MKHLTCNIVPAGTKIFSRFQVLSILTAFLVFLAAPFAGAEVITFEDNWDDSGINLVAQDVSGVDIVFSLSNMEVSDISINGEMMQNITVSGVILPNDAGAPNLPGFSRYIALPEGANVELIVEDSRVELFHNMNIAPAFVIPEDTDDSPLHYEKDPAIYSTNAYYPAEAVRLSELTVIRGVDVVMLGITPFQYNPVTKDLEVYTDILIRVNFVGGNGHFGEDRLRSRWWDPVLKQNLLNYQSLPEMDYDRVYSTDDTDVEYLIIVPNNSAFISWADSLKDWRNQQGIKTGVTTISEIGGNNYTLIENYINNAYNNWDPAPVAVLLLSDYLSGTGSYGITAPYYTYSYSCVSDNFYADRSGNDLPDIALARICAQNATHLNRAISKMFTYERTPPVDIGFYNNPVMAGGWQTSRWFILCSEVIYGYLANEHEKAPVREYAISSGTPGSIWSSNSNTYMIVNYFGPSGLGYIPSTPVHLTDWGGNATRLNNDIQNGCFILQHRDHGSVSGWSEPYYRIEHVNTLTNTLYPYVFSINCCTGQFDEPSMCFAEAFHIQEYGALGLIAATQVSYSFVNDTYAWGMYDYMWPDFDPGYGVTTDENLKPAFANVSGKHYLAASSWPYNSSNKDETYYLFHHHGDAFMTLYSHPPYVLTVAHDNTILNTATSFSVSANNGSLIGLSVDNVLIGSATGTGSPVSIGISPLSVGDTLKVVVTKSNYYRYSAHIPCIPSGPQAPPEKVDDLVISSFVSHAFLNWSPVVVDTSGNPITVSYYVIYRSPDDPLFEPTAADSIGSVMYPSSNYLDVNALQDPVQFYNVKAVVSP